MGSTGRFQEQIKQNDFRNLLNLAVSAFGQKEADNLLFTLPLLHDFVILQVSGSTVVQTQGVEHWLLS